MSRWRPATSAAPASWRARRPTPPDTCPSCAAFGSDLVPTALAAAHLGDVEVAQAAGTALLALAETRGLFPLRLQALGVLGFLALSRGDAATGHEHLGAAVAELDRHGIREWTQFHLAWSDIDALVELGELDRAEALAGAIAARARELGREPELAVAERGLGVVLGARGDLAAAETALRQSLVDLRSWPFERARAALALGVVLRRAKQKRAARDMLSDALALFDDLGTALWAVKARSETARIGGRGRSAGGRAGELTPSELEVARLVAQGNSNRAVADRLFLSTKTVAAHLTSVYAKLGVRSRTELALRLRDEPAKTRTSSDSSPPHPA
jgi:DNA-binding CsgD family transcriptional regulator